MLAAIFNLNVPGHYLNWSILTISVANLVIIAVMVIIFGLALLLPFPRPEGRDLKALPQSTPPPEPDSDSAHMWTAKLRTWGLRHLPAHKLVPDRQPYYVASWIYVFGVASLAALAIVVASGLTLAIGGVDWWHTSVLGHFVNSVHLWGVELFMALMVIHLWGKFWMAAWRGNRTLTWMTGVAAFATSILECFTGYLSQQNFDAQWIATNGKDAVNATGLGSFFNVMNFGQMIMWHLTLIPLGLAALVLLHIVMVRLRGVVPPLQKRPRDKAARSVIRSRETSEWRGPTRRYDIIKEGTIATVIVFVLVIALASLLSSPDEPPITISTWAKLAPADFMATTVSELNGTSETAQYGQPYNHGTANVQQLGPAWQLLGGVHQPIDPAQSFVLGPLSTVAPTDAALAAALTKYEAASTTQQQSWANAYAKAVQNVTFKKNNPVVPKADDGPVPILVATELTLAQSGAIDSDLLAQHPFYGSDYTKPLLFIEDGNYMASIAQSQHLAGSQWGVMNETGSYPGQPWMWLYTLWYQVPSFSQSANVDLIAIYLTVLGTVLLLCVPLIPGLRDIPRLIPLHRLIWRRDVRGS